MSDEKRPREVAFRLARWTMEHLDKAAITLYWKWKHEGETANCEQMTYHLAALFDKEIRQYDYEQKP